MDKCISANFFFIKIFKENVIVSKIIQNSEFHVLLVARFPLSGHLFPFDKVTSNIYFICIEVCNTCLFHRNIRNYFSSCYGPLAHPLSSHIRHACGSVFICISLFVFHGAYRVVSLGKHCTVKFMLSEKCGTSILAKHKL